MKDRNGEQRGLTPAQIRKAIFGFKKIETKEAKNVIKTKILNKPQKAVRKVQTDDLGLLLNLPLFSTQTAFEYQTPDWFTTKDKADVTVVVPIFNNSAETLIKSWDLTNGGLKVELLFVEDNCPVNSKEAVIKEWEKRKTELRAPVGKIICSSIKQGWVACCNIGAMKATADILVFLSPNAKVFNGWLRPLVRLVRDKTIGAAMPMLVKEDGLTIYDSGSDWDWEDEKYAKFGNEIYCDIKLVSPFKVDNCPNDIFRIQEHEKANSFCMAVRKEDFLYIGGFCPHLTSREWADADFSASLVERGLKIICQPNSRVCWKDEPKLERQELQGKTYFKNKWILTRRLDSIVKKPRTKEPKQIKNILVRRRSAGGDVLLATAIAPALKKKFPGCSVLFATDFPEIVEGNPWIDKVLQSHSERFFDCYIDLDMVYEYRPQVNILDAYADAAGVSKADCELFLQEKPIDFELPPNYVVLHSGKTLWAGRNWSTIKFDMISKRIQSLGYKIVCVGTWSDHKTSGCDLDLRDKTTVGQLATVMKGAKLFVGIDSFPMHVAQVFNVPGVVFFGSIRPETRIIRNNIKPVVADGLRCLGCHHRKPTPCTSTVICEIGEQECINNVSVDKVWLAITDILEKGVVKST